MIYCLEKREVSLGYKNVANRFYIHLIRCSERYNTRFPPPPASPSTWLTDKCLFQIRLAEGQKYEISTKYLFLCVCI